MKNNKIEREREKVIEEFPPTPKRLKEYEAHTLLVNLYQARKERDEAKEEFKKLSIELGECRDKGLYTEACYLSPYDVAEWCDTCQQKQPLWQKYQILANKAGAALRACLRYGKKAN
jgi:hypothetical protein